jgi:Flp pilus assembly protein protease CpaA
VLPLGIARGLLSVLLVTAALWDIRKRRIPNFLSASVLLCGVASTLVGEGWIPALSGLGAVVVTVAICWVPWTRGRIGGGDVKLAGAAAAAVGLKLILEYLLATALLGAIVALVCYFLSNRPARQEIATNLKMAASGVLPDPPMRGGNGRVSVPYGVACAAAALLIVFLRKGW